MKVITGRVIGGKIEVEADVKEGTPVLTAEDEDELFSSLQEIRSGKYEDGYELLRELKEMTRG